MATQAAPQGGARKRWIDELAGHRQQVVGGQQQRGTQLHDDQFLRRRERGVHGTWPVRKILGAVAVLPLADRQTTDVVAFSQFPLRERRFADFVTDQMSGTGLAVKGLAHGAGSWVTGFNSVLKSNLALKNGRLRVGI